MRQSSVSEGGATLVCSSSCRVSGLTGPPWMKVLCAANCTRTNWSRSHQGHGRREAGRVGWHHLYYFESRVRARLAGAYGCGEGFQQGCCRQAHEEQHGKRARVMTSVFTPAAGGTCAFVTHLSRAISTQRGFLLLLLPDSTPCHAAV